jgi:hypothetical protein
LNKAVPEGVIDQKTFFTWRAAEETPGVEAINADAITFLKNPNNSIIIYPEGISHDLPILQEVKNGFIHMICGAYKQNGINSTIVPVGLNYFPWGSRTPFKIDTHFMKPIIISPEQHARYQQGGAVMKEMMAEVVSEVTFFLNKAILHGHSFEEIQAIQIIRRLYLPTWEKAKNNEVWNRSFLRFAWLFEEHLDSNEELQALVEKVKRFRSLFRTVDEQDYNLKYLEMGSAHFAYIFCAYMALSIFMAPHFITMIGFANVSFDGAKWSKRRSLVAGNFRICGADRPVVMSLKNVIIDAPVWVY